MHFVKDGNKPFWVTMKEMFIFYQQYLDERKEMKKIILNGTTLNKMIKPFLQMYRKLKTHKFEFSIGEKSTKEDFFRIFSILSKEKISRVL